MTNPGKTADQLGVRSAAKPIPPDAPSDASATAQVTPAGPLTPGQIAVQEAKEAQRFAWAAWAKAEAAGRVEKAEEDVWKLARSREERLQRQARAEEKEVAAAAPRQPVKHPRFG